MIDWLVTNKTLGQAAAKGATSDVVYQHLMHRVLASKAAQRIAYILKGLHPKLYADRHARNFGKKVFKSPKSPMP
jgi:hypothetical protein